MPLATRSVAILPTGIGDTPCHDTPMTILRQLFALAFLPLLFACGIPTGDPTHQSISGAPRATGPLVQYRHSFQPDLPISEPPFERVHANWKQRLDQPYVFIECTGSYVETGRHLPLVQRAMLEQGFEPAGPPFTLFYDDPGQVPVDQLRSRACVPVDHPVEPTGVLDYDVLPSTTVVYAFAAGSYPEVPRCYPGLYSYMQTMGWVEDGPIRETYLISPSEVKEFAQLCCEVQIPVTYAR